MLLKQYLVNRAMILCESQRKLNLNLDRELVVYDNISFYLECATFNYIDKGSAKCL